METYEHIQEQIDMIISTITYLNEDIESCEKELFSLMALQNSMVGDKDEEQ